MKKSILRVARLIELLNSAKEKVREEKRDMNNKRLLISTANIMKSNKTKNIKDSCSPFICPNCRSEMMMDAKFCSQCGIKLEAENIFQTNRVKTTSQQNKNFSEVQGIEKWCYFGEYKTNTIQWDIENKLKQVSFNGQFYYIIQDYVWTSNSDGTEQKIIFELEQEGGNSIFVNSFRIYIEGNNTIKLYDFDGQKKRKSVFKIP